MLVEEQIQARRQRAREAVKKVVSRPRGGPYGDYQVQSTSGKRYRVGARQPGGVGGETRRRAEGGRIEVHPQCAVPLPDNLSAERIEKAVGGLLRMLVRGG